MQGIQKAGFRVIRFPLAQKESTPGVSRKIDATGGAGQGHHRGSKQKAAGIVVDADGFSALNRGQGAKPAGRQSSMIGPNSSQRSPLNFIILHLLVDAVVGRRGCW